MHFERMAEMYADARPPYPDALYELLEAEGVTGPGRRVLEIGAGTGLATTRLVSDGCEVTAVEPGPTLAAILQARVPSASVVTARLEDAELPSGFDSAVSATAMHWVDLEVALPRLHAVLPPGGLLAVWRTVFRDEDRATPFRERVEEIVVRRRGGPRPERGGEPRPTVDELAAGGWFVPIRSERWRWQVDLGADQVGRLFRTFSDWTADEAAAAARAADDLGGVVTEHYQTVLHLLARADHPRAAPAGIG